MKLVFHRLLLRDLQEVLGYYEAEGGPGLSYRFFTEFERIINEISENPFRFQSLEQGLRRANFRVFPYHVFLREKGDVVQILVLRHHKRHPDWGKGRR